MASLLQRVTLIMLGLHSLECRLFVPIIPEPCLNQDYCEDVPNYPYIHVDEVIKELADQGFKFHSGDVGFVNQSLYSSSSGDRDQFVNLCPEIVETVAPQAIKDSTGQWRFVINSRRNLPPQLIKYAVCEKDIYKGPCSGVTVRGGYTTKCEQEYFSMDILILDERGKVSTTPTQIPVCCSCAVYDV
ncbi:spaetzle domain-containing protein [Phthorimaea operculella]|nr:spaetzle domain-containing protein [Phthorimaea operculella]